MRVHDIMTADVKTCTPETTLPQVAQRMWTAGCGALPVLNARGVLAGIITDRDISMALISTGRRPTQIPAWEVMTRTVHTCRPDDDVSDALETMRTFKVRRLPVLSRNGPLEGILSLDDIIMRALAADAPTSTEIMDALREIFRYRNVENEPELVG
jgi:CBS domain-containing protein